MTFIHRLVPLVAFGGFAACHAAHAAELPRMPSPSVDIEVEDRAAGGLAHVARFRVSVANGHGEITAYDGDAKYAIAARTISAPEPQVTLEIKRSDRSVAAEIDIHGAIPQKAGSRVLLARVDRADGRSTTVLAQAR